MKPVPAVSLAAAGDPMRPATVMLVSAGIDGVGGIQRYCRSLRGALGSLTGLTATDLGLGASRRKRVIAAIGVVWAAARDRPDLVVLAHLGLGPIGWACRLVGVRYAVVTYGIEVWGPARWGHRVTLRLAASVWPLSGFTASELRRLYPGSRLVEPLGGCVDERFLETEASPPATFRVLTVARAGDAAYKGLDTCVAALAPLALDHDVEYRVVGAGQTASAVAELIGGPLPAFVQVVGAVDDDALLEEYRRASVVVLVSRYRSGVDPTGEGLGLAILEAGAVGVPGIASTAGGGPETVVDGVTGFLVPSGEVAAVTARFADLLDEERRRHMGRAARTWVQEHHGPETFAARVDRALRASLGGRA